MSRTLGGDDSGGYASGAQQSIATLNGMTTLSSVGTTLILHNGTCIGHCTTNVSGFTSGQKWRFSVVPVPAAVWLFGSALGVMGWMRRTAT